jgi:hypothetical protein
LLATQPDIPHDANWRHTMRSKAALSMELRLRNSAHELEQAAAKGPDTDPEVLTLMADAIAHMRASADQIRAAHDRMVEGMTGCNHAVVRHMVRMTRKGQLQQQEANRETR